MSNFREGPGAKVSISILTCGVCAATPMSCLNERKARLRRKTTPQYCRTRLVFERCHATSWLSRQLMAIWLLTMDWVNFMVSSANYGAALKKKVDWHRYSRY